MWRPRVTLEVPGAPLCQHWQDTEASQERGQENLGGQEKNEIEVQVETEALGLLCLLRGGTAAELFVPALLGANSES